MDIVTSGTIARQEGVDRDEVCHALRKIAAVPIGRAGNTRLYSASTTDAVRAYLKNRRQRKERVS